MAREPGRASLVGAIAWVAQNRMASCTLNGTTSTFTYGSDGLRRRMVTGTNTTDYLLDGQSVVREIKNGTVNATYLNGPRGPEYKRDQNGAVQWYLYDGLGSVVGLVDESGNVTNTRKYDVYGAQTNAGRFWNSARSNRQWLFTDAKTAEDAIENVVCIDGAKDLP